MDALLSFLYENFLLIIHTATLSFALCLYLTRRQDRGELLPVIGLFTFYLLDNLVLEASSAVPVFTAFYDRSFLTSPSIKSVIYLGIGYFTLLFWARARDSRFNPSQTAALVFLGLWLFFIPLAGLNATTNWLYFSGYQVFSILTALWAVWALRRDPPARHGRWLRALVWTVLLMSVVIAAEDTYVIFQVDSYDPESLQIFSRNISEDILRLILCVFFFVRFLPGHDAPQETPAAVPETAVVPEPEPEEVAPEPEISPEEREEQRRMQYFQSLGLTDREMEIMTLLLDDANNQQISETLHISPGTVKAHIHNIYQKCAVTHRYELVRQYETFRAEPPA